jgi:hypothetical protein
VVILASCNALRSRFEACAIARPRAARGLVQRRNGRLRRRRTIYLPPDIDRELSVFCASNGREVSETIAHALVLYLERRR